MNQMEIELAKKSLDIVMDFVRQIGGQAADEVGIILGNNLRGWRISNACKILEKTKRKLAEAGLPPNAVPARLFLPFIDAASAEDDESLQEMWAALLATAMQSPDAVPPSFVETLKEMTPDEARYIDGIYGDRTNPNKPHLHLDEQIGFGGLPKNVLVESYERLGIIRRDYGLTRGNGELEVGSLLRFTKYGLAFLAACRGPQKTRE